MNDYKNTGLNSFYQPLNAPVTSGTTQSGYDFQANTERDAVTNTQMKSISADKITAGTIESSVIYAGSISGSQVTAGTISGAVIYGGSITGNQIAGGTLVLGGTLNGNGLMQIKNSAGTVLIQGDNAGHSYFTTAGVLQIGVDETGLLAYQADGTTKQFQLSNTGFYGFGTQSSVIRLRDTPASTVSYGNIGYGTTDGIGMYITTPSTMYIGADTDAFMIADGSATVVGAEATIFCNDASGEVKVYSLGSVSIYAGTGDITVVTPDGALVASDISVTNLEVDGTTKSAIIQTTKGYKALYAIESPSVWFMDFVDKKDELDPLFLEVTRPPYKYMRCEDNTYQVWGKRRGFENTRFEDKTPEQFKINNELYSGNTSRKINEITESIGADVLKIKERFK